MGEHTIHDLDGFDTLDEVFEASRGLIYHTAREFCRQYGGDIEEAFAEGCKLFMDTIRLWKPGLGKTFSGYLRQRVFGGLLDIKRVQAKRLARLPRVGDEVLDVVMDHRSDFDVQVMKREVSHDARMVIRIVCQTWGPVHQSIRKNGMGCRSDRETETKKGHEYNAAEGKDLDATQIKRDLIWYLRTFWDWPPIRIQEAMMEVKTALEV